MEYLKGFSSLPRTKKVSSYRGHQDSLVNVRRARQALICQADPARRRAGCATSAAYSLVGRAIDHWSRGWSQVQGRSSYVCMSQHRRDEKKSSDTNDPEGRKNSSFSKPLTPPETLTRWRMMSCGRPRWTVRTRLLQPFPWFLAA